VSPKDLASHLSITSASTTVLVDRLSRSGHVERRPHPTDRRALVIAPTIDSDDEVRATLGDMHRRMIEVAESLDAEEGAAVLRFLERMRAAVDSVTEETAELELAEVAAVEHPRPRRKPLPEESS
jgi:DNA-binding MarR family transcriptional regulator